MASSIRSTNSAPLLSRFTVRRAETYDVLLNSHHLLAVTRRHRDRLTSMTAKGLSTEW